MAGLYDQVNGFLNNDRVVDTLTDEFGLATILATRTGVALTVPTVVANLADWLADPDSGIWFRDTVRMVHPESLSMFPSLSRAADFEALGHGGLDVLLGQRRGDVVQRISARADVPETAADGLLAATMWVMTVYLARTYGQHYNREETAGALATEYLTLIDQGWGSWLRDVAPIEQDSRAPARYISPDPSTSYDYQVADLQPTGRQQRVDATQYSGHAVPVQAEAQRSGQAVRTAAAEGYREVAQPAPSGSRGWIYLAGILGALLLVALVGGAFLLGRLNTESASTASASGAIDSSTDDEAESGEADESIDGQADAEGSADGDGSVDGDGSDGDGGLAVDRSDAPATEPDVDDWPGGRGPVPDTPPGRRTLEIDETGSLVLTGSAPNWEVAMQVLMVAEANYPVDGVEIVNELSWHPDAARSIRSGDVVMPQAALFVTGSNAVSEASFASLDLASAILLSSPSVYVVVTGHADNQGDEAINVSIASERVDATVEYLLGQGVIPGQIVTASAGEDDPAASNDTQEGRQSNRRVELLFKNYLATPLGSGS